MLCFMHEAEPYGHLRLNGQDLEAPVLARMVGAALKEVRSALVELERAGVFSRNDRGTIYSRRMIHDEELRRKRAAGGFKAIDNPNVPRPKGWVEGYPSGYPSDNPFPPSFDPSPSSSSSSSSSSSDKKEEKKAGSASPSPANGSARRFSLADSEFITELKHNPAYQGIDIDREIGKLKAWLLTPKGRGKQLTKSRLVNWLNKIDTPLNGHLAQGNHTSCTWLLDSNGRRSRTCGEPIAANQPHPIRPFCPQHLAERQRLDAKLQEANA